MIESILNFIVQIRDIFNHHILFSLAGLLLVGYAFGKIAEKFHLPAITGFIIAGFVLGKSCTQIVHPHMEKYLTSVTEIALGIIALTIGSEFSIQKLKRLGWKIMLVTFFEQMFAFIFVSVGLLLLRVPLVNALLFGAISSATAPATTVVIVRTLRVRGEFVDYLYGVVALDDAGCILLFSLVFALVSVLVGAGTSSQVGMMIGKGFLSIIYALLVGLVGGIILHAITIKQPHSNELMILSFGMIFLTTAVAISLHLSPLLSNMMVGTVIINLSRRNERIIRAFEPMTPPLYAAFFAIAGTELETGMLTNITVLITGFAYIIFRGMGKYLGASLSCMIVRAPEKVRKFLGLCLLPQAGVAIGLVLFLETTPIFSSLPPDVAESMTMLTNVVLFSVFINEIVGPPLSKIGLVKGVLK
ncbi:cation:proton antiporter [bacterium]|nr:cation:proton antiporter [bacterium]